MKSPYKILENRMTQPKKLSIVSKNKQLRNFPTNSTLRRKNEKKVKRRLMVLTKKKLIDQQKLCKFYLKSKMFESNKIKKKLKEIDTVNQNLKLAKQALWLHLLGFVLGFNRVYSLCWTIRNAQLKEFLRDSRFRRTQRLLREKIHARSVKFERYDILNSANYLRMKLAFFNKNHARTKARKIAGIFLSKVVLPLKLLTLNKKIFSICNFFY